MNREERTALLAVAEPDEVIDLADRCLAGAEPPSVLRAPEVGCVSVQVREPVVRERFLLGDVLACRAEVELRGARGWAMRLGDDRPATLAAALLDAAAEADAALAAEVEELCLRVADRHRAAEEAEWAELAPTIVEFEEL
ncbi:phosphonate C-P lyase system protein PhnG [Saccharopolyspora sp. CA-218241]|uniref:phosphonate C-P lyase system protein PhnG n=1 Tax=Saccharopolyspora sp. CA-218241 TaxID=3240027 RepID=UPI003D98FC6D